MLVVDRSEQKGVNQTSVNKQSDKLGSLLQLYSASQRHESETAAELGLMASARMASGYSSRTHRNSIPLIAEALNVPSEQTKRLLSES